MPHVTVVGAPFLDLMNGFPIGSDVTTGELNKRLNLILSPGGPASNVTTALSRLGIDSSILGKVGDDWFGELIQMIFSKNEDIDTSSLIKSPNKRTGIVFPIIDNEGIQRGYEILNEPTQFEITKSEVDEYMPSGTDFLFADGILLMGDKGRDALNHTVENANKQDTSVVFDPNFRVSSDALKSKMRDSLENILKNINYLLLNHSEFDLLEETIFDGKNNQETFEHLLDMGINTVVVKQGKRGHEGKTKQESFSHPAFDIEVSDTQGAGDSFDAGFILGLIRGLDVKQASIIGSVSASIVCSSRTAWQPIPTLNEIEDFLRDTDFSFLINKLRG